ncbi:type IV pilus assembly protein PilM [Verrucomicrobiota bacterium]
MLNIFKTDRIIALSIGASKLVLADFSVPKTGGPELLNYGVGKLEVDPEDATDESAFIVSAVRTLMHEHNIKPAPLLMTISGQSVFPRFVKLPPVSHDKVDQIVRYEAEQNVPFPINEVVWDYELIDTEGGEFSVMLVAVKTENVTKLTDCVVATGLEPEIVDVASMAVYNVVRYNYPDLTGCTMVLDVGAKSSNLIFIEGPRIFSRSIPVAGNAITIELAKEFDLSFAEAEELKLTHGFVAFGGVYAGPDSQVADRVSKIIRTVITRLHAEVNRSINFYRSQQSGSAPSLVLLTGGSSVIPHSDTFFREKLKVDVEYLNPFINVAVSDKIDAEKIAGDLQLMAEITGLALRRALTCPIEINLMPPDLVAKKIFRKRQPFFILAVVAVIMTMLCGWVYCQRMKIMRNKQIGEVRKRIEGLSVIQKHLDKVKKERAAVSGKIDTLINLIALRTQWVRMVDAVHSCVLDGMWVTSLRPIVEEQKITAIEIRMSGFEDTLKNAGTAEATAIEVVRNKLRESECFSDGQETKIEMELPPRPGAYAREFVILAKLEKKIEVPARKVHKKDR